jgi:ribosomal-protein-alanine N-acetyltransferase
VTSDQPDIGLRPATASDIDVIVAIERVAFSDPPWSRRSFVSLLGEPHVRFLVATERPGPASRSGDTAAAAGSEAVLGYVVTWVFADEAEIANLAVAAERRRRGIGRLLLDAAVAAAGMAGARALYLEVREANAAARALYASGGFKVVGRRAQYYRNPSEDALVLRLDMYQPASLVSPVDGRAG